MRRPRLFWQIFPAFIVITVISLCVAGWYAFSLFKDFDRKQTAAYLQTAAQLAKESLPQNFKQLLSTEAIEEISAICEEIARHTLVRVSIIRADGFVMGDSEEDPTQMGNQSEREEILAALEGQVGSRVSMHHAFRKKMMWLAVPLLEEGHVIAVLRAAMPLAASEQAQRAIYLKIFAAGIVTTVLAACLSVLISRRITKPLEEITAGAERFSRGDLNAQLTVPDSLELARLAETMNQMAGNLERLENVRRDFVANVSHELRTPITSIKGFVETLLDGSTLKNVDQSRRFLEIIREESDRLEKIIEDLLSLSRLEKEKEGSEIPLQEQSVDQVLSSAARICESKAKNKNIALKVAAADKISHRINSRLLEQAVVNLLDNAVKYSDPGSSIQVSGAKTQEGLDIRVSDEGCGISKEHIPRIFERFYRVDKARSRKVGGTGLGLSIVKHIAQAHGGSVSVQSKPGKGSTFTIHLPNA